MLSPRLKEDPREWRKFVLGMAILLVVVGVLLWRRKVISYHSVCAVISIGALSLILSWLRPAWFRGIYRVGMTVFSSIGQVVGKILLALFFLLAVTPLGLFLRLMGKDLLSMRRKPDAQSYWLRARNNDEFDRMF